MTVQQLWSPSKKRLVPLTPSGVGGGQTDLFWFRDDPAMCAGVPKAGTDPQAYWAKITALIGVADHSVDAAWPHEILFDASDRTTPRAFSMLRKSGRPLAELVVPAVRKSFGLNWGPAELREVAIKLAKLFGAFERLSVSQCDSHDGNYLLDWDPRTKAPRTLTRVDCLAFGFDWQNRYYGCDAVVYQFLPPELHRGTLATTRFSREADRFSLACLLFPVLTDGGYPWNYGGGSGTPAERVAAKQFAILSPPPGAKVAPAVEAAYWALPDGVRVLFERALLGDPATRPSPAEWVTALRFIGRNPPSKRVPRFPWAELALQGRRWAKAAFAAVRRCWWLTVAALAAAGVWVMLPKVEPTRDAPSLQPAPGTGATPPTALPRSPEHGPGDSDFPPITRKPKNPEGWGIINR